MNGYQRKIAQLQSGWRDAPGKLRLAKSTISNLFRYQGRGAAERRVSLAAFNEVIALDREQRTAEVEGLSTYETVVDYTLRHGMLPLVAPELKHITVGGATVGIGIESTCFRHGFVHDGLVEADVLLPDGKIVTCTPENEHADLFAALPNSYGSLGYILRAKLRLHPALDYVHLRVNRYGDVQEYLAAMREAVEADEADFIEGLIFEDGRYYLMCGTLTDHVPQVDDIMKRHVFYKLVQARSDIYLTTRDYIFRYDPDWFWNVPDTGLYRLFRRYAPRRFRNSSFYTQYTAAKHRLQRRLGITPGTDTEPLIQDWEVPWEHAAELVEFSLREVRLDDRPWAAVPIRTPKSPTLYPIEAGKLYFNLGCYCHVPRAHREPYYYTKIMDAKCFDLGGIKMLYSSTFLSPEEFDARYNGSAYRELKRKYDPEGRAPTLYEKVAAAG